MIKLVKMMNSGVNVPEPIQLKFNSTIELKAGHFCYMKNGDISTWQENSRERLLYVLRDPMLEVYPCYLLCYIVTPDMVFEAEVANKPHEVSVGQTFRFDDNDDELLYSITTQGVDESNLVGTVIDSTAYPRTGKVLVQFNC